MLTDRGPENKGPEIGELEEYTVKREGPGGLTSGLFIASAIILVAILSFGLGRLSKLHSEQVAPRIIRASGTGGTIQNTLRDSDNGLSPNFVAAKRGKRYYYPWCSGVTRVKAANRIHFKTREDAEAAGYTKADNCKGL